MPDFIRHDLAQSLLWSRNNDIMITSLKVWSHARYHHHGFEAEYLHRVHRTMCWHGRLTCNSTLNPSCRVWPRFAIAGGGVGLALNSEPPPGQKICGSVKNDNNFLFFDIHILDHVSAYAIPLCTPPMCIRQKSCRASSAWNWWWISSVAGDGVNQC
jgi:hypothetical protein